MEKKTKIQILQETYDYYTADPNNRRSIDEVSCLYKGPDGKKCAFTRCCNEEDVENGLLLESTAVNLATLDYLKEEYIGHNINFWRDIQRFHDKGLFWNQQSNTISSIGQRQYERLLEKYKNQ